MIKKGVIYTKLLSRLTQMSERIAIFGKSKLGNKIPLELSLGQANHLEEIALLVAIIRSCTHQMDSPTLEAGLP